MVTREGHNSLTVTPVSGRKPARKHRSLEFGCGAWHNIPGMKWLVFMLAGALCGAAAAEPVGHNAAFFYWKAVGLLRPARTPGQLELLRFVDEELPLLPPRILEARPSVLNWLLGEQGMGDALRDAAGCAGCDFGARRLAGPFLDLTHLARLPALGRRACALAQALEFTGRPADAARLLAALLELVRRLDADRSAASGLAAADLMQTALWSLEGLVSRHPSAETIAPLVEYFRAAGEPPFHAAACLRDEAERMTAWLRQDAAVAAGEIRRRAGTGPLAAAAERAAAASPSEFEGWVVEYGARMEEIVCALEQPFAKGAPVLVRLDAGRAEGLKDPAAEPNPLLILLVPAVSDFQQRLDLARAQWDMAALLCAASARRARTGNWPDRASAAARDIGRRTPRDPFSGEPIHYRLARGQPVLGARVPKAMAEAGGVLYSLDPAERGRRDEERFRQAIQRARELEFRELFEPAAP